MKKALAWLLVIAMTAALAVGGTLAYLTDTDEDVNVMTLGKVLIDQLEYERVDPETNADKAVVQEFHNNKPLYPAVTEDGFNWETEGTVNWDQIGKNGYTSNIWDPADINNEQDKMVFVKNKGDFDAYVRTVFAFEAGSYTDLDAYLEDVHLNLNDSDYTWEWAPGPITIGEGKYFVATATYNKVLNPGALTEISLSQIALDPSVTNEDILGFGDTYQVLVTSQAVQADGFEDPVTALNEAFGKVDTTVEPPDVPFDNDSPTSGSGLYNALHYLNADPAGTDITASVTSIVFGKNSEYPEIVNNEKGYLIDVEQDTDAYAYYVNNNMARAAGDNYTIYILSNDKVYAPKNSADLFRNMSKLTSFNSGNLDVSRVENAKAMFRGCSSLPTLDTTGWDFSNATDMGYMFMSCGALTEVKGITNWDLSKNTSLEAFMYNVHSITELDLSGWKLGSLKYAKWAFSNNNNLQTINATGWDLESIEVTDYMFRVNPKLKNVIGSGDWYMPNNTTAYGMFLNCSSLESIEVHSWDFSKVTRTWDLFCGCSSLTTITGIGNWDMGSAVQTISMFNGCKKLEHLEDLSGWDMSSVDDMGYMFYDCQSLTELDSITNWNTDSLRLLSFTFGRCLSMKSIDLSGWDVSGVTHFNSLFTNQSQNSASMTIEEVNLSGWDTSSAQTMGWMFYGCGQLKRVDVSGFNVENLQTMSHMFADCRKLESVDFTGWNTLSLTCMDGIFNDCRSMKTVDMSMFKTGKVREFSQMFEACWALEYVVGLENWDTSSGHDFSEMFSGCGSLKELNLSSFDTRNADPAYWTYADCANWVYLRFLSGCTKLEKITFGPYFDYDGIGNCPASYKFSMPAASGVEGWDGYWYNAETGEAFAPSEIPEYTAATYVAVKPE